MGCRFPKSTAIPSGNTYILVDELQTRLAEDTDYKILPFLENNGEFWGVPADSAQAISEIERMRKLGCTHIIFAWPAMWRLDHYKEMTEYLRTRTRCILENSRLYFRPARVIPRWLSFSK